MCKKVCKFLGVVALITGATLIGLPRYYGLHGRQYIENATQAFNSNQNLQVEITRYSQHWFSSDADVMVTVLNKGNKFSFVNRIHTVYGPLMFVKTMDNRRKFNIGQAFLTFSMMMPANSSWKFSGPMLQGQATISMRGDISTSIRGLSFQSQNPNMALDGITFTSRMEAKKQQVQATIGAFSRQDANFNFMSKPIVITQDLTNSTTGIGLGDLIIRVPAISGEIRNAKFDYKNILIKATASQQNNDLTAILMANVANYQANNSFGSSSMLCKLENLNADNYSEYSKTIREILKHGAPKVELIQLLSRYLPQLLQKSTRLTINVADHNNVSGNTQINFVTRNQNNNLISTADIDWDKFVINNQTSVARTHLAIENLNASTLGKIIDKLGSMSKFNAVGDKRKADLEMMQAAFMLPQVFQANTQSRFITQIASPQYGNFDLVNADIQFANMTGAPNPLAFLQALIINVKLSAPKELVNTILLQDGATIAKTTPILRALNIENKEKYDQLKKYFAYWLQQGYISVDGNNYVSQINIANKETLVNGKVYQPLNPEPAAQPNGQQSALNQANGQAGLPYPPAGQLPQTVGPQYQAPANNAPVSTTIPAAINPSTAQQQTPAANTTSQPSTTQTSPATIGIQQKSSVNNQQPSANMQQSGNMPSSTNTVQQPSIQKQSSAAAPEMSMQKDNSQNQTKTFTAQQLLQ